jgi:hypothetical protein
MHSLGTGMAEDLPPVAFLPRHKRYTPLANLMPIGRGTYGEITQGVDQLTNQLVAIKTQKLPSRAASHELMAYSTLAPLQAQTYSTDVGLLGCRYPHAHNWCSSSQTQPFSGFGVTLRASRDSCQLAQWASKSWASWLEPHTCTANRLSTVIFPFPTCSWRVTSEPWWRIWGRVIVRTASSPVTLRPPLT